MHLPHRASVIPMSATSSSLQLRSSVYEAHDPTGEPSVGNWHAGFGERGLETRLWEPD